MKSFTDIEQSQELAKFLPEETADMVYISNGYSMRALPREDEDANTYPKVSPCWSLAALLDYLSANFWVDIKYLENHWEFDCLVRVAYNKELVDACAEMIAKLHEQNLL